MAKPGVSAAGAARTTLMSTFTILCGLLLTSFVGFVLSTDNAVDVFAIAAIGVGLSLSLATGIELTVGVRNLIRVDILMLWVLYGLTLLEFLFPQQLNVNVSPAAATSGTTALLLGFAGIVVGRHLVPGRGASRQISANFDVRPASIFLLFVLATVLGYLHIFLAVNFDFFEVVRQMSLPRFWQSWSRGQYGGDLFSMLVEVGALIYLIPPLAGLIYARSKHYNIMQKVIVTIIILFTFYYGFASGTRNILASYVITFIGAYYLNKSRLKLSTVIYQGVLVLSLLLVGTMYMLEFRGIGLSNYSFEENRPAALYIDHNLVVISKLTDVFPNSVEYLGFEVPYSALIRPIPRILWPGKPDGLSVTVESAVGGSAGTTVASTFIGEAYISGGLLAVMIASLLYGWAAGTWNRVGRDMNSQFAQLLYVSGFFCAAMAMRSMFWIGATMLPTVALWLYGRLWLRRSSVRRSAAAISPNKS